MMDAGLAWLFDVLGSPRATKRRKRARTHNAAMTTLLTT